MKSRFFSAVFFAMICFALAGGCGGADEPGEAGIDDTILPYGKLPPGRDVSGERNFATLINAYLEGKPTKAPWVGYWWPYTKNGIASGSYGGGKSPAGKYDAARGGLTSSQAWEVKNHGAGVPKVAQWWGHCNGWCVAAALFPEPTEQKTVNGISFSIADQKALLSEAGMDASADFYGSRVDFGQDYNSPKYDDTIPAQYFLVLTNYMGKLGQPVLIDRYTGDQVWNQPVVGYKFEYPKKEDYIGADPSAPNVYRINLTTRLYWGRDDVDPGAVTLPFSFEDNAHFDSRLLKMELWLDGPVEFGEDGKVTQSGNVFVARQGDTLIGGVWRNGSGALVDAHPDYMWVPFSVIKPDPAAPEPYANIHVDHEWLTTFMLAGRDDTSVTPVPIPGAPEPRPSRSARPDPDESPRPRPRPTLTTSPRPTPTGPLPTRSPRP